MKKNFETESLRGLKKLLMIMKLVFVLFFSSFLAVSASTYSQGTRLSLDLGTATVKEVFDAIEKQSEYIFFYQDQNIDLNRQVSIEVKNKNINEVLDLLFEGTGNVYEVKDRQVIIGFDESKLTSPVEKTKSNNNEIQPPQKKTIKGKVTDEKGLPLPGVSIVVKGTTVGITSDFDGNYTLEIPDEAQVLVFSFVGMKKQEVAINGQTSINVTLAEESIGLDEVVAVGYGVQNKRDVTTSISSMKADELQDQTITSFDQGLAGRLPGVQISQGNGAPGGFVNINIRGTSSISGGNQPLIVVDGVPLSGSTSDKYSQGQASDGNFSSSYVINPLSSINPSDIESVEVLKDAAAAAIYGSRGSNGVILITTKSGKYNQKTNISLNAYYGVQQVTKKVDVMDAYEFAEYTKLARDLSWIAKDPANNTGDDPMDQRATSGDKYASYMFPYLNGEQGLTNTDWQDEIFRTAPIQSYDLSVNGGKENFNYSISGSYFNQEGIVINSGIKRYTAKVNLNAKISKKFRVGINLKPSFSDNNMAQTEQNWWKEGIIISALMYHPNLPVRNPDGSYALGDMIRTNVSGESSVATIENPVALAELIDNYLKHSRLLGNSYLEFDIMKDLTFKTSIGVDMNYMDRSFYRPKVLNWRNQPAPTTTYNYGFNNSSNVFNILFENTLNYKKAIGKHNIQGLLGYTAQKERNQRTYLEGNNFPNDIVRTLNAAQTTTGYSDAREWSMLSMLGRIQYDYSGKYLLSSSLRRDGSSRFGKNTKWGWFPSVSAGWRVSEEAFLAGNETLSNLKLRGSYGLTGNTDIPYYGSSALLGNYGYVLGDKVVSGIAPYSSPNESLSWEKTSTIDIGLDFGFFNNKLNLTVDYYKSNTRDLLLDVTVPSSSGFDSSLQNIGELENKGFEFLLSTNQKFGDLTWSGSLNFTTNHNEIIALAPGQTQITTNGGLNDQFFIVKVGESLGSYYGYKVLGVFETVEQFESTPHLEGQKQDVGDFIYADVDGDGDVDPDDRTILGDNNPNFTWGFTNDLKYKNISLSFSIQGKHGFEIFNSMHRYTAETWGNNLAVYNKPGAPRPVWGVGSASHTRASSWHVEDGSFVRIRNITLGYTLPQDLLKFTGAQSTRFYVTATNPFTFTNYSGYNPEVSNNFSDASKAGEEFGNYPVAKSFILGVNVNF